MNRVQAQADAMSIKVKTLSDRTSKPAHRKKAKIISSDFTYGFLMHT